jgi:hypothetical protein
MIYQRRSVPSSRARRWLAGGLVAAVAVLTSSCAHPPARHTHGHRGAARSTSTHSTASDDSRDAAPTALLTQVRAELAAMRRTRYQHTTDVRPATGEYYYDCSGLLDYALACSAPPT